MWEYQNMITKMNKKRSAHILPSQSYEGHSEKNDLPPTRFLLETGGGSSGRPISVYAINFMAEIDEEILIVG